MITELASQQGTRTTPHIRSIPVNISKFIHGCDLQSDRLLGAMRATPVTRPDRRSRQIEVRND